MQQPIVIDFEFNDKGVWMVVKNLSTLPIISFMATFSAKIWGMPVNPHTNPNATTTVTINNKPTTIYSNRRAISDYKIFSVCEYLAPQKQIILFAENQVNFFVINPPAVTINVQCQDSEGTRYNYMIKHNFEVYKQNNIILTK